MTNIKKPPKDHASPSNERKSHVNALWKSLVQSAFDFFEQAVRQHDSDPKYAILHLAASVELFLKARLMAEHWTLIVSPKKAPTFDQLRSGDFVSVTLLEAIDRVQGVMPANEAISKEASSEFQALAKERNKIAHFFHSGLGGNTSSKSIVQRQCRVWLYLHRLLVEGWAETFTAYEARLNKLDTTMREERKFLTTIFDDASPQIEKHREAGHFISKCLACEFDALLLRDSAAFTSGLCLVCRYQNALLHFECPGCEKDVIAESGYARCLPCNRAFTPEGARDLIGGNQPEDDTGMSTYPVFCCQCATDTVFEIDGRYLCTNCMEEWERIEQCEWCNEYNSGVLDMSYVRGCAICDGMIGWKGDRD